MFERGRIIYEGGVYVVNKDFGKNVVWSIIKICRFELCNVDEVFCFRDKCYEGFIKFNKDIIWVEDVKDKRI